MPTPRKRGDQLLRSVLDSLEGRICILGADGTVLGTNWVWDELVATLGPAGDDAGGNFFRLLPALGVTDSGELAATVREVLAGAAWDVAMKGRWVRGDVAEHVVIRVHAVTDHDRARAVVTVVDITRSTQTQEELRRTTERAQLLALVAEHTENSVVITDAQARIEWVNDAFCQLTGYSREEATGRPWRELWQGRFTRTPALAALVAAVDAGRAVDVELPAQNRDGDPYWAHLQVQPIRTGGELTRIVGIERDITRRRRAAEALRMSHQQAGELAEELMAEKSLLGGVLAAIPHLVYWKDRELRYLGVNRAFLRTRGLPDESAAVGRTEAELSVRDALSDILGESERAALADGLTQADRRVTVTGSSGRPRDLLLSVLPHRTAGSVAGVIGIAADVTHISELERQLAQASRLESIGQLAAGIAHEINTPVQYVSDNTRFVAGAVSQLITAVKALATAGPLPAPVAEAVSGLDLDFLAEEVPSALAESLEGLARVAEIVKAMKEFSHPGTGRALVELNRVVESTVQVCRNEWRYVADVRLDLDPALELVPCFEGELKQVLLNIVVNAAQAIAEQSHDQADGGLISVSTRQDDEHAVIVISDNGPGMDEATQLRIFDPFFTTKDVGKGTGQGLSMAYAIIVQKHGGAITVASAPGQGTAFTLTLPLRPPAPPRTTPS